MKIFEQKQVVENKSVVVGHKCDNCGTTHIGYDFPDDWHEFNGHYCEQDGYETQENYTACSPYCYAKLLQKAVDDFRFGYAEIDGMTYAFASTLAYYINKEK